MLLFADHILRSLTCKRFAAKRVAVNGVNSNMRGTCNEVVVKRESLLYNRTKGIKKQRSRKTKNKKMRKTRKRHKERKDKNR